MIDWSTLDNPIASNTNTMSLYDIYKHTRPIGRDMVYVVGSIHLPYYKIGYTTSLTMRLTDLQIGNPYQLSLYAVFHASAWTENQMHLYYKHKHYRGEWFMLSHTDIADIQRMQLWPKYNIERFINSGLKQPVYNTMYSELLTDLNYCLNKYPTYK